VGLKGEGTGQRGGSKKTRKPLSPPVNRWGNCQKNHGGVVTSSRGHSRTAGEADFNFVGKQESDRWEKVTKMLLGRLLNWAVPGCFPWSGRSNVPNPTGYGPGGEYYQRIRQKGGRAKLIPHTKKKEWQGDSTTSWLNQRKIRHSNPTNVKKKRRYKRKGKKVAERCTSRELRRGASEPFFQG